MPERTQVRSGMGPRKVRILFGGNGNRGEADPPGYGTSSFGSGPVPGAPQDGPGESPAGRREPDVARATDTGR